MTASSVGGKALQVGGLSHAPERIRTSDLRFRIRLKITLSRRSFRILQLNRRIRTRATVTLRNAAGLSSTASKQITLKAPKRRALHLRRRAYRMVKSVDIASRP
jgi:hypothetical protein